MSPNRVTNVCRCIAVTDEAAAQATPCTRRELLGALLGVGLSVALSACGGDPVAPLPDDAVAVDGRVITLRLDRIDALRTVGSAFVLGAQSLIVLRVADRDYRAFSNVCTHSGCGIFLFERDRMRCQCHGSEFDVDGVNVAGPAPSPLTAYPVQLDVSGTRLTVTRTA